MAGLTDPAGPVPESVFTWAAPPLKFGRGAVREIGSDVVATGARSCLVVTDPGVAATGVPDQVREQISRAGLTVAVFDQVGVEPTDRSVQEAISVARERTWDSYVAVGGGSAIDTAKAVNLMTTQPGRLLDYVTPPLGAGRAPTGALRPLIAVPTTAGTGSESTTICVIDLLDRRVKAGISHPKLRPSLAVIDPDTTLTMPPEVTAASGMDVICHALESYTALPFDAKPAPSDPRARPAFCGSKPISDAWCELALSLAGRYLRRAVADGRDTEARWQMMLAATYAGAGFGNAGTHLPHANAYPVAGAVRQPYVTAGYPPMPMVPHGQAVSITAPAVFRWTYPADPQRHTRAAELLTDRSGGDGPDALADALTELIKYIGMPIGLGSLGYTEDDLDTLVEGTLKQTRQLAVVPRPVTPRRAARHLSQLDLIRLDGQAPAARPAHTTRSPGTCPGTVPAWTAHRGGTGLPAHGCT